MGDENTGMTPEPEDTTIEPEDTTIEPQPGRRTSGLHPVNVGHLVMGIAFVGLTVIWALIESGTASASDLHWLLPIPWVVAGAVGLAATVPRMRGSRT